MSKRAPSTIQLLTIVGFALSCFGILLFLWVTFGGPTPFKARPYQLKIPFNEATQLAEQSDVRISGVNVGKVQSIELAPNRSQALATVDIEDKYAPLPESTRAILRTKTLLGETYIELTPGSSASPEMADGGTLPAANIAESVQLDEIFRTFDPETREAFQDWMKESSIAINGQGENLSYALGQLEPTFQELDKLFRSLDSQRQAVGQLFRNGATTFSALRGRNGEVADLIRSSNAVFQTTARRDEDIEALFRAFPTFLDESRVTTARLREFAVNTDPLMKQLVPAAEELSPTLVAFGELAPEAKAFFEGLGPVIKKAPKGFAAGRKLFRDEFPPLLRAADPFLRNLNPLLTGLNLYKHEVTALFGNIAASSLAETVEDPHPQFLRVLGPINPETYASYPSRLAINRNSAYSPPKWAEGVMKGLPGFDVRQCSAGLIAALDATSPTNPNFSVRAKKEFGPEFKPEAGETVEQGQTKKNKEESEDLFKRIQEFAFAGQSSTASVPAPPCRQQNPMSSIYGSGAKTLYQQTFEQTGR